MKRDGARHSLWQDTTPGIEEHSSTTNSTSFDVIIAGAGITGLTTGLLLQKAGKSVLIAEAHSIGFGTTGGTTAHLNTIMDTPYHTMIKKFGEKDAQLVAKSIKDSLSLIRQNVKEYQIDCGFRDLDGYLFSQDEKQTEELEEIYTATKKCGVEVEWSDQLPLPIPFKKVLRFPGHATFHPTRYLATLVRQFEEAGGVVLENCRVTAVKEDSPLKITTTKGHFSSRDFIYATHIPPGVNLLHFRCAPYRSYAIAARLQDPKEFADALVYDMYDPYHYYRMQEIDGETYFIGGGEDHKTGHEENTEKCFCQLESYLNKYFRIKEITNSWSSQYFEPTDGRPYIGHLPGHGEHVYVATGYGGNGMTYSGVAALTLTDMIVAGESEFEELYDPNRIEIVAGFNNFVKEAADVTGKLFSKIFPADKLPGLSDLAANEARVVKYDGHKLAIYRDEDGKIFALNPACTHIKCDVAWNNAEKSWDCPCHGSRFSHTGEMMTAPARKDLEIIEITEKQEQVHTTRH